MPACLAPQKVRGPFGEPPASCWPPPLAHPPDPRLLSPGGPPLLALRLPTLPGVLLIFWCLPPWLFGICLTAGVTNIKDFVLYRGVICVIAWAFIAKLHESKSADVFKMVSNAALCVL